MSTWDSIIFGISCGLFVIFMVIAIMAAANRNRAGKPIATGYPTAKTQASLIGLVILSAVVWTIQAFTGTHTLFIVFTALGINFVINPSVLGEKGLKLGVHYVPRDRIIGYTIQSKGTKTIIHFQVQGKKGPLVMVVNESRNKDLKNQLLHYFAEAPEQE
ncbi:hypothetical protein H8B09_03655 [Paenibacillus sp. PR3]|uniref:DUF5673 domain-containing protein n=1 Tax=Paenibacillus terricola TaxID=2763503 RepID=A0ABR8MRE9_9BACL|nr:hypothetical protein [Paenibacillus terricola]MBD3917836.1 hypothetical protein [Paenibacillus terricola]